MWKPLGKRDYIDLGHDFFLIKLSLKEDHSKVLKGGPWLISGHYISIRGWEQYFRPTTANFSIVVVWVCLLKLPIEYYKVSMLWDIKRAIGPVL